MLKLNKLYSNKRDVFPPVSFIDGVNVIFADVTKGKRDKSSHSLGKTTLLEIIDYVLLKKVDSKFFLKRKNFDRFSFYLEIDVGGGRYLTIKRPVSGKIAINVKETSMDCSLFSDNEFDYSGLGIEKAKAIIDSNLRLDVLSDNGWVYRKGLRYCLRRQNEYELTFKVKPTRESDQSWKPYLAGLLGISPQVVERKYVANSQVEAIENAIKEIKTLPQESSQSLEAEMAQIEASLAKMTSELDNFDFRRSDIDVNDELVDVVSRKVSDLNKKVYEIDQRVHAINESMEKEFSFDIDKVFQLFSEVEINFPDELVGSYEALVELNEQMSSGRKQRLAKSKSRLVQEKSIVRSELDEALKEQSKLAEILIQRDAFEKYKLLQYRITKEESRLAVLKDRIEKLDSVGTLSEKLDIAILEQLEAGKELERATRIKDNNTLRDAVSIFSGLVEDVLGISAFFYVKTNSLGNIVFEIGLKDQTSVADGYSYTRVLSAIFDITLLILYSEKSFYRFAYHDGLLESLDDRVKHKLIQKMRDVSKERGLQLIISVLDSDIPLGDSGEKCYFSQAEVRRTLHDKGDSGRLFKMKAF